jgi:hypothetical protein
MSIESGQDVRHTAVFLDTESFTYRISIVLGRPSTFLRGCSDMYKSSYRSSSALLHINVNRLTR